MAKPTTTTTTTTTTTAPRKLAAMQQCNGATQLALYVAVRRTALQYAAARKLLLAVWRNA